ncbi:MAG TPA: hypothetical protein VGF06_12795 [Terriglobales bacterium]|jgi:hypothetical protein
MALSTNQTYRLLDIRQIGPNRERDISGICSGCGATLFVALTASETPSRILLEQRLQSRFAIHLAEAHST